ncbi:YlzJ-like family protein [Paenibacillus sp. HN-1]|uniref:YlzJ-like family protein n=1 Tax=Paenibacillus TaxID=44249 RepID=UPI001CA9C364|nr:MULTISPECIES: YlzJ-like family protein [Paenibacillus]MBY9081946.1 YlzJ-like family protein [Paenibacillus sp. CGMCC 1.18879]MBY9085896.1 YlzJ-like family protein [Paenibacillus sinensis]
MIIYSIMPPEQVWEGAIQAPPSCREVLIQGILMQVEPLDEGRGKIVRLLNCPLNRYLDSGLAPGTIINLTQ